MVSDTEYRPFRLDDDDGGVALDPSIFDEEEVEVDDEDVDGVPIKKGLADDDDDDEVVTTKKSDDDDPIADRWL